MQLFSSAQKGKTHKCEALDLVLIIDRSGSMDGTERGIMHHVRPPKDAQRVKENRQERHADDHSF